MTTERKARYITIAVLGAVVVWLIGRQAGWRLPTAAAQPEEARDAIYRMLDAARSGDAAAYLDCFSGQTAAAMRQSRSEMGADGFARYLAETSRPLKGVTLSEPVTVTDRQLRIQIEYVYEDRNEGQQMHLERTAQGWRIARIDWAERLPTLVPYWTKVELRRAGCCHPEIFEGQPKTGVPLVNSEFLVRAVEASFRR